MTPHIFGVARARVRSADVAVLSQWLKGEILQVDPDAELASVVLLAADKHPTDRSAFLADVLKDSSLLQVLSVSTVDELLLRFDARKETSCSLPVKTMPVVGQADSTSSGVTNRYLSLDPALGERSDRDHLRDSRLLVDQVESRLSDYAECEHVVQPRGP